MLVASANAWAMAKSPTRRGSTFRPPMSITESKVNRAEPVITSTPTQLKSSPTKPEISPFRKSLLELAIRVSPNSARAKYSGAWNFSAHFASTGEMAMRQIPLKIPPVTEAIRATVMAFPAFPFWARGWPSRDVAAAEGVPGVWIRIAGMEPPYMEPQKIPAMTTRAWTMSSLYTSGSSRMIPMDPESPGMAPITMPLTQPTIIIKNVTGWNTPASEVKNPSKIVTPLPGIVTAQHI